MATTAAAAQAAITLAALGLWACATAADRPAVSAVEPRMPAAAASSLPWASLTPAQQQALASLKSDWAGIEGVRQKKWLELANRFQTMPEAERARIQQRMAQWASLTPAKRHQVRLQFLEAQHLPPEQRQARWQEYQALSADEKQTLAHQARQTRPVATNERTGAKASGQDGLVSGKQNEVKAPLPATTKAATTTALQAKPGATTRPLTTPATPPAHHQPGLPKIVATEGFVDPSTLLPKRGPQGAAVRSALTDGTAPKP